MLNFTYAGVGNRLVAQIIDAIIVSFASGLIVFPIFGFGIFSSMNDYQDEAAVAAIFGLAMIPIIIIAVVAPVLYEAFMLSSVKQATIGKIVMKIKVVDEQGQRLTFGAALGRSLIKYVSANICALLWLWPFFNPQEQALHDLVVKDFVIREQI